MRLPASAKAPLRWARDLVAETLRRLPVSSEALGPPKDEDDSFDRFLARGTAWTRSARQEVVIPSEPVVLPAARIYGPNGGGCLPAESYASAPAMIFDCPEARIFNRPPGILSPDDRLFAFASCWHSPRPRSHFAFQQLRLGRVHWLAGRTLYLGGSSNVWHFYADTLRQVALLSCAGRRLSDFDHIVARIPTTPVEKRFYDALGLTEARLFDREACAHLKCEHLTFFSSPSSRRGRREVAALRELVFGITGATEPSPTRRRLYVSRAKAVFRRVVDESRLVERLRSQGFECLCLEDLTPDEQIGAFRSAGIVAGPHGAGLAHVLFCRPGTTLIELRNPAYVLENGAGEAYRVSSGLLDVRYVAVEARATQGDPDPRKSDLRIAWRDLQEAIAFAESGVA